jgi:signal transduction histidine kinase
MIVDVSSLSAADAKLHDLIKRLVSRAEDDRAATRPQSTEL